MNPDPCPTTPLGGSACAEILREKFRQAARVQGQLDCDITVSTAPPLVLSPYGAHGFECPHGVVFWIEPTSEQIIEWGEAGIA